MCHCLFVFLLSYSPSIALIFILPMAFFIPVGIGPICTTYLYKDGCVMVYYMLLFCMGANNNLYLCNR